MKENKPPKETVNGSDAAESWKRRKEGGRFSPLKAHRKKGETRRNPDRLSKQLGEANTVIIARDAKLVL